MSDAAVIAERLAAVQERIRAAAERVGRDPAGIRLVGISKRKPAALVAAAARAGLAHVGENYLQEALPKREEVRALLEGSGITLRWHFVGHVQRNKAKAVAQAFDVLETLDRESLGRALERHAAEAGNPLETLVQVNVSGEPQKAGVAPEALGELLAASSAWPHLRVTGLMAIPAPGPDAEASRPAFAKLRELAEAARGAPGGADLHELSMGMSADFEIAVEEGATIVRVGTALFGPREEQP